MPIVGMNLQGSVITMPVDSVVEVVGSSMRRGFIEVCWEEVQARIFADDIVECCEKLQEPDLPEH